jgi:hypothetical protein
MLGLQSLQSRTFTDDALEVQVVPLTDAKPTGVGVDGDVVDGDDTVVLEGVRGQAPPGSRPVS